MEEIAVSPGVEAAVVVANGMVEEVEEVVGATAEATPAVAAP